MEKLKSKKLIILILLLLIILISVIIFLLYKNSNTDGNLTGKIGSLPGTSIEELQKKADSSKFSFEINSNPIFKNNTSAGNLRIANPNYNVYPIKVIIRLDSNKQIIFESGIIEPNHYIENAKLKESLPKGDNNATATIQALDPKTHKYLGEAKAKLNIQILN